MGPDKVYLVILYLNYRLTIITLPALNNFNKQSYKYVLKNNVNK